MTVSAHRESLLENEQGAFHCFKEATVLKLLKARMLYAWWKHDILAEF